jgi:hypothetical protein
MCRIPSGSTVPGCGLVWCKLVDFRTAVANFVPWYSTRSCVRHPPLQFAIPEAHEAELRKDDDPTAALMESLPEAHGDRFVVPDAITLEQLEDTKRGVCALLPFGTKYEDWYPPLVVTYASGRRTNRKGVADDCEGSGPGVMYAKGLMEFLHERGLQCFSGLQVPAGVDWETFMLRLTGENGKREKPKVLIIILTAGLFQSKPCLKEISTAIENKIALLPVRFEDKLPAKEEQWTNLDDPDWEMMKFHVQAKLNKLNNIPNPGTVLNRPTSLQDIVAAIEKNLPAPASPATTPTKPSGGPSGGPRFPVGSRVYVDQGHGQESLAHVATYNAARGVYVVELGARGSGALEICSDKDLRKDDNPLSQLIDSARERVGSLFGITPLVMEREGATTGNEAASEPTSQPPASPAKPTQQLSVGSAFKLNERVECRDRGQSWQVGTVVSVEPLKVQPDGATWTAGHAWDEVRVLSAEADGPPKAPAKAAPTSQPPPPPPPGLKLEGGSLPGEAAKYPGTYRLDGSNLVNGRPAYQHTSDATRWIAFAGNGWKGQRESSLGERVGCFLNLADSAAASPDVSAKTWTAWNGSAWVEVPQLKCTAWSPPPPGLKLEGGSGEAAQYMGFYVLDGKLVNGRPAWKHTNGRCWVAFSETSWIGQPEANLGQKLGFLMLTDAAAASPDASSATWQAWTGSALAAQPQLKCTIATAAELSAAQAAAALRAKEERRARAAAQAAAQAAAALRAKQERRAAREAPVKNFRGPCADCCKPLAPCCCVSADGEAIFGCVPTDRIYLLPACLHMALCPQLGCDPKGGSEDMDCMKLCLLNLFSTPFVCCIQGGSGVW